MSVTQREFPLSGVITVLSTQPVAYGNVSGDRTTITLIQFYQDSGAWLSGYTEAEFPKTCIIDGITYRWTINETMMDGLLDNKQRYVKRATLNIGARLTINKPFFPIVYGQNSDQTFMFSFYDLGELSGVAFQEQLTDTIDLDGKTPIGLTVYDTDSAASAFRIKLSTDATYRFTWIVGNKRYATTRRISAGQTSVSATYTPPAAWCEEMPDSLYLASRVTVEAVFGTVAYQSVSDWFTAHVPDSFVPGIGNIQIADTKGRVPAAWGMFVQDNSNISIRSIALTPAYGSAINKVVMTVQGKVYSGTPQNLPTSQTITTYGVIDVTVKVTDTRFRSSEKTARVTFVQYSPPTLQVDSMRCDANGQIENEGTYFLATTQTTYSPCNGKNTLSLTMRYKITSDTAYTKPAKTLAVGSSSVVCGGDLDTEFSYDVEYILKDALNTITVIDYVSTGVYCIHFLHGGRGVAFGNKATREDYADFAFNAIFRGSTTFTKDSGEEVTIQQIIDKLQL